MKTIKATVIIALLALSFNGISQSDSTSRGDLFSFRIGAPINKYWGLVKSFSFSTSAEFEIHKHIAIGPEIAYSRTNYTVLLFENAFNEFNLGARALLRLGESDIRGYAGFIPTLTFSKYRLDFGGLFGTEDYDKVTATLNSPLVIGVNGFFSDKAAVNFELRIGQLSSINLGMSFAL